MHGKPASSPTKTPCFASTFSSFKAALFLGGVALLSAGLLGRHLGVTGQVNVLSFALGLVLVIVGVSVGWLKPKTSPVRRCCVRH